VVDSTAAPVATVIPFNAWPLYVAGLVAGTIPLFPDERAGVDFFIASIPYNFYGFFAVAGTLAVAVGWLPFTGRGMRRARDRSLNEGLLDAPAAEPMLPPATATQPTETVYTPHLADFLVPLGVLLSLAIGPYPFVGTFWINEAFMCSLLSAMLVAGARGMPLREILDAFLSGCMRMTIGAIILGLAVTLGTVSKELGTGPFVVLAIGDQFPAIALPALLMAFCMGIAFATGTSWGTYAVVFPIAMPLAFALQPEPAFIQICFGAVLGGAVFGDQCSPISDTTILSSMFTGCDLMDHVRTQLPLALTAAALGALLSTLAVLTV
jgi:Na+/H+ antiporter NhaC